VKEPGHTGLGTVRHCEMWGLRDHKYQILLHDDVRSTRWQDLNPTSPDYLFAPVELQLQDEYKNGFLLTEAMPESSIGVVTARDSLTIHFTPDEVWDTVQDFVSLPAEEARAKYELGKDVQDWTVAEAQKDLRSAKLTKKAIVPFLYRPFDVRYTYYTGHSRGFHCRPRREIMTQMLTGENLGFIATRTTKGTWDCGVTNMVMGHKSLSAYDPNYLFPLFFDGNAGGSGKSGGLFEAHRTNFSSAFLGSLAKKLNWAQEKNGLPKGISANSILAYIAAVLHSTAYRMRFAGFLKRDFPRIPITSSSKLFLALAEKGQEVININLMVSDLLDDFITEFPVKGSNAVDKVEYLPDEKRVWINAGQYFGSVPQDIWEVLVGGYQPCEKWLQDRKGRKLSYDDVQHWQRTVVAIKETMKLVKEIDAVIPGWPLP
jgi:Type ISP C-terminal specificity domain